MRRVPSGHVRDLVPDNGPNGHVRCSNDAPLSDAIVRTGHVRGLTPDVAPRAVSPQPKAGL